MFELLTLVMISLAISNIVVAFYAKSIKAECNKNIYRLQAELEAKIEEQNVFIERQRDSRIGMINALTQFKVQFEPRLEKLEELVQHIRTNYVSNETAMLMWDGQRETMLNLAKRNSSMGCKLDTIEDNVESINEFLRFTDERIDNLYDRIEDVEETAGEAERSVLFLSGKLRDNYPLAQA